MQKAIQGLQMIVDTVNSMVDMKKTPSLNAEYVAEFAQHAIENIQALETLVKFILRELSPDQVDALYNAAWGNSVGADVDPNVERIMDDETLLLFSDMCIEQNHPEWKQD